MTFPLKLDLDKPENKPDLWETWAKSPTPQAMKQVVDSMQPLIDGAVFKYVGPQASPIVKDRARLLAVKAVKGFKPTKGASLPTFVNQHLQALQHLAPQISDPLPVPERLRRVHTEIAQAADVLTSELGREPTDEEISSHMKQPLARVIKARKSMRSSIPQSVYDDLSEDNEEMPDLITQRRTDYDDWMDAVHHDLGDIDKLIMQYRTGYRGTEKLDNVAVAKKLGITPAAVSQRAARIQARLDEFNAPARGQRG